jgi:hypothetical protein
MGWKNVKEGYDIGHIVQVTDEGICIGSAFLHTILLIGLDGVLKKTEDRPINADILRYQSEMLADPERLRALVTTPDTFHTSIPVYTFDDTGILEKQCEKTGWPNVTHDGCLMYENSFSTDLATIVSLAKANARSRIVNLLDAEDQHMQKLNSIWWQLEYQRSLLAKLELDY